MPQLKTYKLFISHAWQYDYEYFKVVEFLDSVANFKWNNFSVPEHNPKIDPFSKSGQRALIKDLENQVRQVNCFLAIGRMYLPFRYWIQTELDIAFYFNKPIITIVPRNSFKIPKVLQDLSWDFAGWNRFSIVDAIRKHSI